MGINQKIRVALSLPGLEDDNNYFAFLLQSNLSEEHSMFISPSKLFAVSDMNIDFYLLCKILIRAGVMNRYYQWTFDEGHLMVWADQIGSENLIKCFWLIYSLEEAALRKGGHVHVILGTETILSPLDNKWRLHQPQYAKGIARSTFLYDGNNELWRWLNTKNFIEQIGENIYTQLDISQRYFFGYVSITEINKSIRARHAFKTLYKGQSQNSSCSINIHDNVIMDELPVINGVKNIITRRKNSEGEILYWAFQTKYSVDKSWTSMCKFFMLKKKKFYLRNDLVEKPHIH
ncbi:metallophosphoesterase family protein [Chitinophaga pinensis]|uniref:Uncharacterized protein n=1 Tax=Chitinophaga pinensis (strain ATCC 43595 / DSM 2588 / LMG 13176 / NBRC 15968 / NCIMB 11800 / UQM 2034) TaxID=485918 RepID=A0A979GRG0_CHIPD|nr:hypothetical protein [Chitinophaga pinensis]ACU58476.1 hypothetical protein Cpin_0978 [Chitinophaga pinensis DSM 2588]